MRLRWGVIVLPCLFLATACGVESDCPAGNETCACFGNGTCNDGLTCASDRCVSLNPADSGHGLDGSLDARSGDSAVDAIVAPVDAAADGAVAQGAACTSTAQCAPPSDPCRVAVCIAMRCATASKPDHSTLPDDTRGDCQVRACIGGTIATIADGTDVPDDDGDPCTLSACNGSTPTQTPLTSGEALPPDSQVDGDCQLFVCGASGVTVQTDATDLPPDPANPCLLPACNGATPGVIPASMGRSCGSAMVCDGSGSCVDEPTGCGVCVSPDTCGGGGQANVCGCTPRTACGGLCGVISNDCGGDLDCGACACTPTQGGIEVCDGVDNDCDLAVDEGSVCRPSCTPASYQGVAYLYCSTIRTWLAAEQDCQAGGMHLVRIESSAENSWVKSNRVANNLGIIWIGARDVAVEGDWRWIGGSQFWSGGIMGTAVNGSFVDWETVTSAQPDNDSGGAPENCASLPEARGTGWNDVMCTGVQRAYVCERYSVPVGCFDVVQNGNETGIDCGGSCAASCTTCSDGVQNGNETGIDCGGSCPACQSCVASACTNTCAGGSLRCCTTAGACGCRTLGIGPCI